MPMRVVVAVVAGVLLGFFLNAALPGSEPDLDQAAHAAVHELDLQIDECGDSSDCDGIMGTLATDVAAWALENDDRVDAYPIRSENGIMVDFPGTGAILTMEFYPESGRLRSWTVR